MNSKKRPFPFELFNKLSKRELQDFLEILHYSVEAETDEDVKKVLGRAQKIFPCEHTLAGVVRVNSKGSVQEFCHIINISYPNDWLYQYAKNGYADVDPVLTTHAKTLQTQVWKNTYRQSHSKKEKEFIEHARSFGLENGVTAGSFDRKRSLCSFVSFASRSNNTPLHQNYVGVLEYLVHRLHYALIKNTPTTTNSAPNILSTRELSVLQWMTQGKTNWEISRILGVSERTIRFHVEGIFCKLDVTSRSHAVAMAIESRMLTYA